MKLFYSFSTILILFCSSISAQNNLNYYIENAFKNNLDLTNLDYQIKYKNLNNSKINAQYKTPKIFVSADYLLAPYFNNNGQFISTNPSPKAIGYDAGITNGGNYSALINTELPLLNRKLVSNLKSKNTLDINTIKTDTEILKLKIKKYITYLYFEAYRQQTAYKMQFKNIEFLKIQLKILKALTDKGIYKLTDYQLFKMNFQSELLALNRIQTDLKSKMQQLKSASGISANSSEKLASIKVLINTLPSNNSLFLDAYKKDSLGFELNKKIFNTSYLPQLKLYANSGLNATNLTGINRKIGLSAGLQLNYTLFDGHQKRINNQQQQFLVDNTTQQKKLKKREIQINKEGLLNTIKATKQNLEEEKQLLENNQKILNLFKLEVQKAQVSIINYLSVINQYSTLKLDYEFHKIDLYELINEYNYWNN